MAQKIGLGSLVETTIWVDGKKKIKLIGQVEEIDGAYHYVKIVNNSRYDVLECYEIELKLILTQRQINKLHQNISAVGGS